ncbi:GNAT family N-acetyltransferase [Granulicoccus phenolivorans]|uniref:GNAT family N-acetyltransferase n=1 Tax=Granulicoccus phenolivorans TaxID=266854 RepID=UPI00138B02A1|nr:GNAT family N-acetyltransferase [Granulicoccus phenolivorans]
MGWEADVLLSDGSTAHLRPIRPDDADRLVAFYARVSPESKYLRFFAPYPELSDADVKKFTEVDYDNRVALIITVGDDMVAVGRYDRLNESDAEVAFLVQDDQQGRGLGQLLLEHLAETARERHVKRFVAEILPQNRRMVSVFSDAGYTVSREYEDGIIACEFAILPTESSVEVMQRREHRAESTSVRRLLHPHRIAVVGTHDRVNLMADNIIGGGFAGAIFGVATDDGVVSSVPQVSSVSAIEGELDLVISAVPIPDLAPLVIETAEKKTFGMVVLHAGEFGGVNNQSVVALARSYGVRALGPDSLGLINTDPTVSLNASPGPTPRPGVVGMFCQSSAVGVILLSTALEQNLGLATFISSGVYADVTNNDVMQYWQDDEATKVCVLSLDRIGNPRKFARIVRRLAQLKPVVLFSPGRSEHEVHLGASSSHQRVSEEAIDQVFAQSGVIVCNRRDALFDVAQILARQPLPKGDRVRVITNSPTLSTHIRRVGTRAGLDCSDPVSVPGRATPEEFAAAVRTALAEPDVHAVVCAVVDHHNRGTGGARRALAEVARTSQKPLLAVFADFIHVELDETGVDGPGHLPTYSSYADAIQALAMVRNYARWKETDRAEPPQFDRNLSGAHDLLRRVFDDAPAGRRLSDAETAELLACYGIDLVPRTRVHSLAEALAEAERQNWNVILKATNSRVRGRPGYSAFSANLDSAEEVRSAWEKLGELVAALGLGSDAAVAEPVIQTTVPTGTPLDIRTREDASFGPIVALGLQGLATEILGDRTFRVPPLTRADARSMLLELKSAPLLWEEEYAAPNLTAVVELLYRIAQLADDLPQVANSVLSPCLASASGVAVVGATIDVVPTAEHRDAYFRSLE